MYAASKLAAEALLRPYAEFFEVVVARLFGVYGPGQTGMLFAQVINKVLAEEEIELQGGTGVRLNPLYIDDCVAIIAQLCKVKMPSTYEIFNVGGDEIVDLARVVREVEILTGKRAQVRCTSQTPVSLIGSITKLRSIVHGVGATILAEGLGKTVSERVART
jgi:nucleoside-diphosphate-sugar epimerase